MINNLKENFKKISKKTKILLSIILIMMIFVFAAFPFFLGRLSGNVFQIKNDSGVEIKVPEKILVGNPGTDVWAKYNNSVIWDFNAAQIKINNPTDYKMTINEISITNGGSYTVGDSSTLIMYDGYSSGMVVDEKSSKVIRIYGGLSTAIGYNDPTETLTVSYTLNGNNYSDNFDINFYHKTKDLSSIKLDEQEGLQYTINYFNNESEPLKVNISRNQINMDVSEDLYNQNVVFTYESPFGNYVKITSPQSADSKKTVYGVDLQPRLSSYIDFQNYDDLIEMQAGSITSSRVEQRLYGGTNHVTDGVKEIYIPMYFRYCKNSNCGTTFGAYARNSFDSNEFSGMDSVKMKINIYDKSSLYQAINDLQAKLDAYDDLTYEIKPEVTEILNNAVNVYNTRAVTQSQIDDATNSINNIKNSTLGKDIIADYERLNSIVDSYSNLDENNYESGWAEFKTVYDEAKAINEARNILKINQSEVDNEVTKLVKAYNDLFKNIKSANYEALNEALSKADNIENTSYYNLSNEEVKLYTEDTWAEFASKLNTAKNCSAENILEQSNLDECETNLSLAMANLIKNGADYSKLNQIYEKVTNIENLVYKNSKNEDVTLYTESSWNKLQKNISDLQKDDPNLNKYSIDKQDVVNGYTEKLSVSLIKNIGDYSSIDELYNRLLDKSKEVTNGGYTDNSKEFKLYDDSIIESINTIYNSLDKGLLIDGQEVINKAYNDINSITWKKRQADFKASYDTVSNLYLSVGYVNDWYNESSFNEVINFLDNTLKIKKTYDVNGKYNDRDGKYNLTNTLNLTIENQKQVDVYTNELKSMISNIKYKKALGYYSGENTLGSVEEFHDKLANEKAKKVYDDLYSNDIKSAIENYLSIFEDSDAAKMNITINNQDKMDDFLKEIGTFINNLESKKALGNYSKLKDKYEVALALDSKLYENIDVVNNVIEKIVWDYKLDNQDLIDNQLKDLESALGSLVYIKPSIKEANMVMDKANNIISNKVLYNGIEEVENTFNKLNTLLQKKDLNLNDQDEIDNLTNTLKQNLEKVSYKKADYSKINALKELIKDLKESDYNNYYLVKDVLDSIKYNLDITNQSIVDNMYKKLLMAFNSLQKKEEIKEKSGNRLETIKVSQTEKNNVDAKAVFKYIKVNDENVDITKSPFKVNVPFDTKKVNIKIQLLDDKAVYSVSDHDEILRGENVVKIFVIDNDGNTYNYELIINRKKTSNKLSSLKIKGYSIKFDKDITDYDILIDSKIDKLDLSLETEDSNAKVSVIGNENLENKSVITIKVEDQDSLVKIYTIKIRKPNTINNKLIIIGSILFILCIGVVIFINKKMKK